MCDDVVGQKMSLADNSNVHVKRIHIVMKEIRTPTCILFDLTFSFAHVCMIEEAKAVEPDLVGFKTTCLSVSCQNSRVVGLPYACWFV